MDKEEGNRKGICRNNNDEISSSSNSIACLADPNPCPICLGSVTQDSYLDRCLHKFCNSCILHWAEVSNKHSRQPSGLKCPICKTESFSVIHGYDGSSFQRHYINKGLGHSFYFSKAHKYRLQCYYVEQGPLLDAFHVSRFWKSSKFLRPNLWLNDWLMRELQALIQEEDVGIILHHIMGVIDSFRRNTQKCYGVTPELKQEEFKCLVSEAAKPFLHGRTDRFVNELELFLASGMNIEAYDKVYIQRLGWKIPEITKSEDVEKELHVSSPVVPSLYFLFEDYENDC